MTRSAPALLTLLAACTPSTSSPADAEADAGDVTIYFCDTTKTEVDAASGELVLTAKGFGKGKNGLVVGTGSLDVAIEHRQLHGGNETKTACTVGTTRIEKASYAPDKTFTVRLKVPAECPRKPPDGFGVLIAATVRNDGKEYPAACGFDAKAPAALGGEDRTFYEQIQAAKFYEGEGAKKTAKAAAEKLGASLAPAMRTIDATKLPASKTCAADVTGSAVVLPYEVVARAASIDAGTTTPAAVVGGSRLGELLNSNDPKTAAELVKSVESAPTLVVLATTVSMTMPSAEFGESKKGRMTPGRHRGGLFVVDRNMGVVLCATSASSESSNGGFEGTTPTTATQAMLADFRRQIDYARTDALKKIAPALVLAP